jgi:hypothetical protein
MAKYLVFHFAFFKKERKDGMQCGSLAECLPSMHETLGSIFNAA